MIVVPVAIVVGCLLYKQYYSQQAVIRQRIAKIAPGWVYFLSSVGGADEDPPAPIKVGMTRRDPAINRLPEIETMSPRQLEILAVIKTTRPELLENLIHKELKQFRHHGEWFDRDATLAWLDNYNSREGREHALS